MVLAPEAQIKDKALVEIERLNFTYHEVSQYDLDALSVERRVQVREPNHYAPKENVEQYAIQMGESVFPPIVVTRDAWLIDGNTRVGARLKRKEKFSPAIVVEADWSGASPKQRDMLEALAATLNAQGGQRLTAKETRAVAEKLIHLGWKAEQIGRAIGLRAAGVTAVKQEIEAVAKLHRVGIDLNGSAKAASLRALGNKDVIGLNDVPFKELAELAVDAGFNASEIRSAAKAAKQTGSDELALSMIRNLRIENNDRIAEHNLTGHGKPPMSRQLRQRLGFVTKFVGKEHELLETDPNVSQTHIDALDTAIAVLTEVRKLQVS